MAPCKKSVCVVGAGESGLAALKECVLQGMEPTCYDLDSDIGGLWHKKQSYKNANTPAVWPSLVSNSSKYNMCFSDFPPDPKDPLFISPQQLCDYFKRVIKHFDMEKYIHLNTRVIKVQETPDHKETGRWEVYTCSSDIDEAAIDLSQCRKEIFDCVIICSGWFKKPHYPNIPGMDQFKGSITHSFTYSDPRPFDQQKVLVVGNKFSAAEIVSDVSNRAQETYLALGKGTWIIPRLMKGGVALDMSFPRNMIWSSDPEYDFNELVVREACGKMDHLGSGVGCSENLSTSPLCISDDLPVKIASGKIKPYGHLAELKENSAIFKEGEAIHDLDAIIFCTGYRSEIPFLDLKIHSADGKMEMYNLVFPLNRKHNTLGIIGHYGTDGPMIVMGENQARFAVSVMVGVQKLPSQAAMARNVDFWNTISYNRRPDFQNYLIPGFAFMDAVAIECGFYPSFWKIFLRDPVLAWRTWAGPYLAAQYRLLGPGSDWNKAREVCYTGYKERLHCVRHTEEKMLDRPDIRRRRKAVIFKVFGLSVAITGIVALRIWKNGHVVR